MRRARRRGWPTQAAAVADFARFQAERKDREVRPIRPFIILGQLHFEEISPEEAQAIAQEQMRQAIETWWR